MKTTTDKLFKLIKSMSPAEKRYFKRHYGSESNTLTHLYDAINQQKEYKEETIKELFSGKVATNLKVYKFQLEQLLLKSLASHRHFSTIGSKIRLGLEHFEILLDKNLTKMAQKQLEKTKQLCLEHENYEYMPVILAKETTLKQVLANGMPTKSTAFHQEAQYYTEKMMAHYEHASKLNRIIDLYLKSNKTIDPQDLENFLNEINIQPRTNGSIPKKDKLLNDIFDAFQKYLTGNHQQAQPAFSSVLDRFTQKSGRRINFSYYFLSTLRCAIDNSLKLQDTDSAIEYIKMGQTFCAKNEPYFSQQMLFAAYEVQLNIIKGQLDFLVNELAPKYEIIIKELELENEFPTQLFYGWMALAALFFGESEKARVFCSKIQAAVNPNAEYVIGLGRILEFVIYFETPDFQKMAQFLKRVKEDKAYKFGSKSRPFYNEFIRFADKLATNPRSAHKLAQNLQKSIWELEYGPLMKLFFDFKLDKWLLSIIKEDAFRNYFSLDGIMDKTMV